MTPGDRPMIFVQVHSYNRLYGQVHTRDSEAAIATVTAAVEDWARATLAPENVKDEARHPSPGPKLTLSVEVRLQP